ncbi:hypothetical protein [Streptomyces sp. NPDC048385]|uniref:hypothetical protein n=1 Tax=unclassified Streptomyces TaxID=2593676 RepID=UPI0034318423
MMYMSRGAASASMVPATTSWRTLRALAEADGRIDEQELDGLIARAERQMNTLEKLRVRAVRDVLLTG